jgi:hypothetical protein
MDRSPQFVFQNVLRRLIVPDELRDSSAPERLPRRSHGSVPRLWFDLVAADPDGPAKAAVDIGIGLG